MWIESLQATGFRNLAPFTLPLQATQIVVIGDNGQGKTNVLEALYLCATGRSFRNAPLAALITHGGQAAQLQAHFQRQGIRHQVRVNLTAQRRVLRLDDKVLKGSVALLQAVNVVAFFPEDLHIAKGPPEGRRRFLDRFIANAESGFAADALAYQRILLTRNSLLRQRKLGTHTGQFSALLPVYNQQLVHYGARLHAARQAALAPLAAEAALIFKTMMGEQLPLGVTLSDGLPEEGAAPYAARFAQALRASERRDLALGSTTCGPHRADVIFTLAGKPARLFASQGQARSLVLALKLAEVRQLAERLGQPPILLLDDVSSELDTQRAGRFFEAVAGVACQIWLSTTGLRPCP